jgi:hypothetical protein
MCCWLCPFVKDEDDDDKDDDESGTMSRSRDGSVVRI